MEFDLEQPAGPDSEAAGNTAAQDHEAAGDDQLDNEGLGLDSQEQPEEENDEIEVDGKKFALPKSVAAKLQAERMFNADYTQKTQSLAEERRQFQAQAQQQQQNQQHYINEVAEIVSIQKQLKQIEDMNIVQYVDTDPQGVQRVQEQRRVLESQLAQHGRNVTQLQEQSRLNEQQTLAKQVQEADAYFKREITGWSPERSTAVQKYAIEQGIPADTLFRAVVANPSLAKVLDKAEKYDALLKKQAPKPQQVPAAKPAIRVGGNATVQKDPAKMSDKEFAAWRRQQIQNRK